VPKLRISKPFTLTADDWIKIFKGAALAAFGGVGAYIAAKVIPTLQEHAANELGALIVAIVATALPIVANIVRKWLGETVNVAGLLIAAALIIGLPGIASAQYTGATAAILDGGFLQNLLHDPALLGAILLGACLVLSKLLKVDLTPFIVPIVNSLLKPPSTPSTPAPTVPGPAPTPTLPAPTEPNALLQLL